MKSRISLDVIKGQKTIEELATEYGVYSNQESSWKKQLLKSAPDAFPDVKYKDAEKKKIECDRLYQKVSQLQIEVDWLKKDSLFEMNVSKKVKCKDGNDIDPSNSRQYELLQLPRSSYYRLRSPHFESTDNL